MINANKTKVGDIVYSSDGTYVYKERVADVAMIGEDKYFRTEGNDYGTGIC